MITFHFKKERIENWLTIILIVVFVLIKVNPFYYSYQFIQRKSDNLRTETLVRKPNAEHRSTVIIDKSIFENADDTTIPGIKFTGIPFVFFFWGFMLFVCNIKYLLSLSYYSPLKTMGCVALRTLRL